MAPRLFKEPIWRQQRTPPPPSPCQPPRLHEYSDQRHVSAQWCSSSEEADLDDARDKTIRFDAAPAHIPKAFFWKYGNKSLFTFYFLLEFGMC